MTTLTHQDYTVGWICALWKELAVSMAMLDTRHASLPKPSTDPNTYILGSISGHNVVLACLPAGQMGTTPAATVATHMSRTFPGLRFGILAGIGGGIPNANSDIRLGDVVVTKPTGDKGGLVQHDFGRLVTERQIEHSGSLNAPPPILLTAINALRASHEDSHQIFNDRVLHHLQQRYSEFAPPRSDLDYLFKPNSPHVPDGQGLCENCNKNMLVDRNARVPPGPHVHYGNIGSGNQVIQDPETRDQLGREHDLLCFKMEAAGLNNFPRVVIRGISDYADSHKNKLWKRYASATAAVYAKELLSIIQPAQVVSAPTIPPTPSSCTVFANHLFPLNSVALGRLVASITRPWEDYCPHPPRIASEDIVVTHLSRMHEILERCKQSKVYSKLSRRFISLTGQPLENLHTVPEKTYFLNNSGTCLDRNVQKWFKPILQHRINTYMIVAIHTLWQSSTATMSGSTEEQVFAIQYQRVKFNWFWNLRKLEGSYLEQNNLPRWTVTGLVGRDDDLYDEEVEAELAASATLAHLEDEEGETFCEEDLLIVLE